VRYYGIAAMSIIVIVVVVLLLLVPWPSSSYIPTHYLIITP